MRKTNRLPQKNLAASKAAARIAHHAISSVHNNCPEFFRAGCNKVLPALSDVTRAVSAGSHDWPLPSSLIETTLK
jgi:hypothetical protein